MRAVSFDIAQLNALTLAADIVQFAALAFAFALAGTFLVRAMASQQDIFGAVPQWVEQRYGVESKVYKLATCPNCLSAQIAFWCLLLPLNDVGGILYRIGIVCASGAFAGFISKWQHG